MAEAKLTEEEIGKAYQEFAAELKAPSTSQDEKRLAFKFLLHFVGDLHQPLHAADENDRVHASRDTRAWDTPRMVARE